MGGRKLKFLREFWKEIALVPIALSLYFDGLKLDSKINLELRTAIVFFMIVTELILIFFKIFRNRSNDKLNDLKRKIHDLNENIKEFSELNQMTICWNGIIFDLEEMFENKNYMDSVQIYRFEKSEEKDSVVFKVNYFTGYTRPECEINAILNIDFIIPMDIYNAINDIVFRMDNYENALKQENPETGDEIAMYQYKKILNKRIRVTQLKVANILKTIRAESDINDEMCVLWRLNLLLEQIKIFLESGGDDFPWFDLQHSEKLYGELMTRKRTGFLPALLINDIYGFYNSKKTKKKDRIYGVARINLAHNEQCLILIAYNEKIILEDITKTIKDNVSAIESKISAFWDSCHNAGELSQNMLGWNRMVVGGDPIEKYQKD